MPKVLREIGHGVKQTGEVDNKFVDNVYFQHFTMLNCGEHLKLKPYQQQILNFIRQGEKKVVHSLHTTVEIFRMLGEA